MSVRNSVYRLNNLDTSYQEDIFNICHINVQGMINKIDLIECFLKNHKLDILCVSEHWLLHNDLDSISIFDYKITSHFSRGEHIHGGSLILAKNNIHATELMSIKNLSKECHIEICAISYFINNRKIINICLYRPPNGDINVFTINLSEALNVAMSISRNIILCGDFNIDYNKNCLNTNIFNDIINAFDLTVTLTNPIRIFTNINGYTSSSCIDYMITNLNPSTYSCSIIQPNIADHLAHILSVIVRNQKLPETGNNISLKKHIVNENTLNTFNYHLSRVDWSNAYFLDFPEAFQSFIDSIVWCFEVSCPVKKVVYHNKKHNREWFTEKLKLQNVHLKNLFWITVNLKCPVHKKLYDDEKKKYRNNIKLTKQTYYNTKINNSSNKSRET